MKLNFKFFSHVKTLNRVNLPVLVRPSLMVTKTDVNSITYTTPLSCYRTISGQALMKSTQLRQRPLLLIPILIRNHH